MLICPAAAVLAGGVLAPVFFVLGVVRIAPTSASLLLNLEAPPSWPLARLRAPRAPEVLVAVALGMRLAVGSGIHRRRVPSTSGRDQSASA